MIAVAAGGWGEQPLLKQQRRLKYIEQSVTFYAPFSWSVATGIQSDQSVLHCAVLQL